MEEIATEEREEYTEGFIAGANETINAFHQGSAIAVPDIEDEIDSEYYWYYMGRQDAIYYYFYFLKENEGNIEILQKIDVPNLIIESFVERVKKTNEEYGRLIPIGQFIIQKSYK